MRAGLLNDTFLEAQHVEHLRASYENALLKQLTPAHERIMHELVSVSASGRCYDRLARSIAPAIYGHEDVKRSLLLLLVAGVTRQMPDGMKIRGMPSCA